MGTGEQVTTSMNDQYYMQVSETMKNVLELSTRIDERVQISGKKQDELEKKMDAQIQATASLGGRISVLESKSDTALKEDIKNLNADVKVLRKELGDLELKAQATEEIKFLKETVRQLELKLQMVEKDSARSENRWKIALNYGMKIIWVLVVAYLLYRLGLQSPPR